MWRVNRFVATDSNGNYIELDDDKVVISTLKSSGCRVYRNFELKDTPPCLAVAVNDLLKLLTEKET